MSVKYFEQDIRNPLKGRRVVSAWLQDAIAREGRRPGTVNVIFCSDAALLEMNRTYLGHDYFTDIITFDDSTADTVAGELYISVDTVRDNAASYGVTFTHELRRVIVHGVLHLCGYGDKTDEQQQVMRGKEDFYLSLLS